MPNQYSHATASNQAADRPAWTLPILASVLGHAIILVAIGAPIISPPKTDTGIETTLVGQAEFTEASQALKAHHDAQTQNATAGISAADQALLTAQNQYRYQQPRVRHSTSQISQSQPTNTMDSPSFDSDDSDITTDASSVDSVFAQAEQAAANPTGSQGNQNRQPSRDEINSALSSVKSRIESIWQRYPNQPNQTISFKVNLDSQGNVTGINFGGGHPDLRESVTASVHAAAPYRELAGLRDSFTMQFNTEQLITAPADAEPAAGDAF